MTEFVLGMNAKIYLGAADAALSALTVLDNAKDVNLTLEAAEADVTTRGNQGWRATASTLRTCTVEFESLFKPSDANFAALSAAFRAGTSVRMAPLTGDKDTSGSEGPLANFVITNFSREETLEGAVMVSVTAKLSSFAEWVQVA